MVSPAARKGDVTGPGNDRPRPAVGSASSFSVSRSGGTVVVTIHGEIHFDDWARIAAILRDLIDAQGNLDVVLDLCEVVSLERDAVPLIVHAARQAHTHGGRLRLADRACRDRWRQTGA